MEKKVMPVVKIDDALCVSCNSHGRCSDCGALKQHQADAKDELEWLKKNIYPSPLSLELNKLVSKRIDALRLISEGKE